MRGSGSPWVFLSKEQTLQGWHCQSQRVTGDFSSLLVEDGFPPQAGTPGRFLLCWRVEGVSLQPYWVHFGWETLLSKTPHPSWNSSVLLTWVTLWCRRAPGTTLEHVPVSPARALSRAEAAPATTAPTQLSPSPPPSPFPPGNPWITCYLNEPLARLLWLLTFLNDES